MLQELDGESLARDLLAGSALRNAPGFGGDLDNDGDAARGGLVAGRQHHRLHGDDRARPGGAGRRAAVAVRDAGGRRRAAAPDRRRGELFAAAVRGRRLGALRALEPAHEVRLQRRPAGALRLGRSLAAPGVVRLRPLRRHVPGEPRRRDRLPGRRGRRPRPHLFRAGDRRRAARARPARIGKLLGPAGRRCGGCAGDRRELGQRREPAGSRAHRRRGRRAPGALRVQRGARRRDRLAAGPRVLVREQAGPAHPQHDRAAARLRSGEEVPALRADPRRPAHDVQGRVLHPLELSPARGAGLRRADDELHRLDGFRRGIRAGDPGRSAEGPGRRDQPGRRRGDPALSVHRRGAPGRGRRELRRSPHELARGLDRPLPRAREPRGTLRPQDAVDARATSRIRASAASAARRGTARASGRNRARSGTRSS